MRPGVGALALVLSLALLPACASFAPLREPPPRATEMPPGPATTRAEVIALFGPPDEVRASDLGEVLVYRRRVVVEANPNRYYGQDRGARLDRYERVLLYLDGEGRIVRTSSEPEE
ncbi:MAG TPA: hypothetical protein VGX21_12510 [Methylomirabilota bacterium]|nr:hypothetical protein [Methylomirabilota bacterium]